MESSTANKRRAEMNERMAKRFGERSLASERMGYAFRRAASAFRRLSAEVAKLKEIRRLSGYDPPYLA